MAVLTLVQVGGWAAYGVSSFLSLLAWIPPGLRGTMCATKMARAAVGMLASYVLLVLYRWVRTRRPPITVTVLTAWGASAALGFAWMRAFRALLHPLLLGAVPPDRLDARTAESLAIALESHLATGTTAELMFVLLAWSGMYHAIAHWSDLQEGSRQVVRARQLAQRAQVDMLSYQINPHFLFNALNSIRAMIAENASRAKEMVTQLAVFLRYALAVDATRLVTVAEEFEMVNGYLAIEAIRFEKRLNVECRLDPDVADWAIPRFIVHPLVENAVKHGRPAEGGALHVRVRAEKSRPDVLTISVLNTGALRKRTDADTTGLGVGWRNIRRRLELLYYDAATFTVAERAGWVVVTINLPAIRQRTAPHA